MENALSYDVEITAKFPSPQIAGKFLRSFEEDHGYSPDRDGSVVTCRVRSHGDEFVLRERARELGGDTSVTVLVDDE
jgi:hypothetical protein